MRIHFLYQDKVFSCFGFCCVPWSVFINIFMGKSYIILDPNHYRLLGHTYSKFLGRRNRNDGLCWWWRKSRWSRDFLLKIRTMNLYIELLLNFISELSLCYFSCLGNVGSSPRSSDLVRLAQECCYHNNRGIAAHGVRVLTNITVSCQEKGTFDQDWYYV